MTGCSTIASPAPVQGPTRAGPGSPGGAAPKAVCGGVELDDKENTDRSTHVFMYRYACICIWVCVCYLSMYIHIYIYIYIYIRVHMYVYIYMCVCV